MLSLFAALLLAVPLVLVLEPGSRLWIEGDSNRSPWSCDAGPLDTDAQVRPAEEGRPAAIDRLRVALRADGLRCGDDHMDGKLRDALKANRYPRIEFVLTGIAATPDVLAGAHQLKAVGTLEVAGQRRTVTFLVRAFGSPDGSLHARGELPILMTSFGIDPPSAFFGLLQSKDRIVIRFGLHARARSARLVKVRRRSGG